MNFENQILLDTIKARRQIVQAQEKYIISFFGSLEAALNNIHLYEFEETTTSSVDEKTNIMTFHTKYVLRRKDGSISTSSQE